MGYLEKLQKQRRWVPVPLDDLELTDSWTADGTEPIYRVLCPCGARPIIDEAGPAGCPGCRRRYRWRGGTQIEREEPVTDA